jgi:hypothetical protein
MLTQFSFEPLSMRPPAKMGASIIVRLAAKRAGLSVRPARCAVLPANPERSASVLFIGKEIEQ